MLVLEARVVGAPRERVHLNQGLALRVCGMTQSNGEAFIPIRHPVLVKDLLLIIHVAELLHKVRIPVIPHAVARDGDAIAGVLHVQHELRGVEESPLVENRLLMRAVVHDRNVADPLVLGRSFNVRDNGQHGQLAEHVGLCKHHVCRQCARGVLAPGFAVPQMVCAFGAIIRRVRPDQAQGLDELDARRYPILPLHLRIEDRLL